MTREWIKTGNKKIPLYCIDTLVIGSGCAGYNAADWLYDLGERDILIITDGKNKGTSRNTGSDKQTYYKLSLASDTVDSITLLAKTLYDGGGVHGDIALTEAACSAKCFFKLANLGVPFPTNSYGEYTGYKTDNDDKARATSAGPLTSKYMTECLERSVVSKSIETLDNMLAVKYLIKENAVIGMIAIDLSNIGNDIYGLTIFKTNNIIMATGGPAGVYYNSSYPVCHKGMTGMALEAGAIGINLAEWQYGLASIKFRWNVSGTYQQSLPRYISVDKEGREHEFLLDYFDNPAKILDMVFLKGYEWPFDTRKLNESSAIDRVVHQEIYDKGNRVFMDFRSDPTGLGNFKDLSNAAYDYLESSGALIKTPIARLEKMNPQAVKVYRENNIDLHSEMLEIGVCAQHNNGGIEVDTNWQSNISGLYVAGEAAGTFGVYRPGGAALNSTQVGSMRAAEHISNKISDNYSKEMFAKTASHESDLLFTQIETALRRKDSEDNPIKKLKEYQKEFSAYCAHIRDKLDELYQKRIADIENFYKTCAISETEEIPEIFITRDILICQAAILSSAKKAATEFGHRGSAFILDRNQLPKEKNLGNHTVCTRFKDNKFMSYSELTRPLPKRDNWFETVWSDYTKRSKHSSRF